MKTIIDHCSECDCGSKKPIVNKARYLCAVKNHLRKTGETPQQTANRKHKEAVAKQKLKPKKTKPSKKYVIKPTSQMKDINKQYTLVIEEISHEREPKCTGCGKYQGGDIRLSNSHIISRQECRNIGRLDLITDKRNITYHCLDFGDNIGCHRIWESKKKVNLLDYDKNMEFIKQEAPLLYQQKINLL